MSLVKKTNIIKKQLKFQDEIIGKWLAHHNHPNERDRTKHVHIFKNKKKSRFGTLFTFMFPPNPKMDGKSYIYILCVHQNCLITGGQMFFCSWFLLKKTGLSRRPEVEIASKKMPGLKFNPYPCTVLQNTQYFTKVLRLASSDFLLLKISGMLKVFCLSLFFHVNGSISFHFHPFQLGIQTDNCQQSLINIQYPHQGLLQNPFTHMPDV